MSSRVLSVLVLLFLCILTGPAVARQWGPPPVLSPEVMPDRSVIFRLRAPAADSVSVSLDVPSEPLRRTIAMERDSSGVWTGRTDPLEPEIYGYRFVLDGVAVLDPQNADVKIWQGGNESVLEVPGEEPMFYDQRDVPHGVVHHHRYFSEVVNRSRPLLVYTPPGFEADRDEPYPVLVLLHGVGDREFSWVENGRANFILDNLIADGEAVPMVVAMPYGHPVPYGETSGPGWGSNTELMRRDVVSEILPFLDRHYNTSADPDARALAGLSMGGQHTLYTGIQHNDLFAHLGAFSAAGFGIPEPVLANFLSDSVRANNALSLFWIAVGEDDFLLEWNRSFDAQLTEAGIDHVFLVTPGKHNWSVWRHYLRDFATLLFRPD